MPKSILTDSFNRKHNYLRISLTERCNLRCTYCMPLEGIQLRDKDEFMSQEELLEITKVFVSNGVDKIRLTGGEPLIKKNFATILKEISKLPVSISLTTNAVLLDKFLPLLIETKVESLNISLDSLQEDKFNRISRRKDFTKILNNIYLAIDAGLNVKLNVVLMKDENEDEIIDFIEFTRDKNISVRFIEFMPFNGNKWDWSRTVSEKYIQQIVAAHFQQENVIALPLPPNSTSRNFKIKDFKGQYGIISSITNPFCDTCNRIRLTADGKVKNCLFSNGEADLLTELRNNRPITPLIAAIIQAKKQKRAGIHSFEDEENKALFEANRSMTTIGG
jgi:molybdenum cofactor biosynthesis protein A